MDVYLCCFYYVVIVVVAAVAAVGQVAAVAAVAAVAVIAVVDSVAVIVLIPPLLLLVPISTPLTPHLNHLQSPRLQAKGNGEVDDRGGWPGQQLARRGCVVSEPFPRAVDHVDQSRCDAWLMRLLMSGWVST